MKKEEIATLVIIGIILIIDLITLFYTKFNYIILY